MNNSDIELARKYIGTISNRNPKVPDLFERMGYKLYDSDGGTIFVVKKDAPEEAHALASTAAQGDPDAIDAIYADTDAEVESEYRIKHGPKASGNSSAIANAARMK